MPHDQTNATLKSRSEIEEMISALLQEREAWSQKAQQAIVRQDWTSMAASNADTCTCLITALRWVVGRADLPPHFFE